MKLNLDKLQTSTLVDIVISFERDAICHPRKISIVGGAPRTEFQIKNGNAGDTLGAIADSPHKAWQYAAETLLKI